jgi:hypothetical protein
MYSLTSEVDGDDWSVSHSHCFTPQGKSPWCPLDRRMGEPQSRSGCGDDEKNSQFLQALEPPFIQLIAQCYTTELSRLLSQQLINLKSFLLLLYLMMMNQDVEGRS